jgi:hypothetical protein
MKKIKPKKSIFSPKPYADSRELIDLVLSSLPIKDNPRQPIKLGKNYLDCTNQVKQLLKLGIIKRKRKYGYGRSGKAGNTYFVKA